MGSPLAHSCHAGRPSSESQEVLDRRVQEGLAFLKRIITGDECWVHFYDPETKQQSSLWKKPEDPTPVKPRTQKSAGKILAIIFFDSVGVIYKHFVPQGQTINAQYYVEILGNLRDAVKRKRPELRNGEWLLLHDNAPPHTAGLTQQFLARNQIETVPHPPYSPDLAPCDFWLFPQMKKPLRGRHFQGREELQTAVGEVLRDLDKDGLLPVFEKWCDRLQKCINIGVHMLKKHK